MKKYLDKIEYVEGELEEKIRELLDKAKGIAYNNKNICNFSIIA